MKTKVLDYVDFDRVNTLLEDVNKFTGFVTAILDLEGKILSSSGWKSICVDFHRANPKTRQNCLLSDTELSTKSKNNKFNLHKCHNGLYDAAVPIIIKDEHVANLFTGQFFFEKPSTSYFLKQAKKYGFDEEAYMKALNQVPIVTEAQVKKVTDLLLNITQIIIDLTTDKIEQEHSKILFESSLESPMDIFIRAIDKDYNYLYFNKAHKELMKFAYDSDIEIGMNIADASSSDNDIVKAKRNYDLALSGKSHKTIQEYGVKNIGYFETVYNPIYSNNKEIIGATAFAKDITEFRIANNKFKESFDRLNRSQKIANVGSWEVDLETNLIWASQEALNIYELPKDSEYIELSKVQEMIIPEEREMMDNALSNLIQNGDPYNVFFSLITKTKKKYIHSRASLSKNSLGEPTKVLGVIRDVTELKQYENKLIYLSYHDSLTGLHNRRYYLDNLVKLDIPQNYPLTIVMLDINGLKLINDAFGHESGDKLLISAANLISDSCRETDLVSRVGGDEFVIVMPNTNEIEVEKIIEKLKKDSKRITIESIELSISFGYETKNKISEDIQGVYKSAEDLMYREKLIEIPSMRSGAINTILNTLHEKDNSSEIHSRSVSEISEKMAMAYGMNNQEVSEVKTAGLLHDIGKIIIPISIISKEGELTTEEYEIIKGHSEIGFRILNSTHDMGNISYIVLSHHERWDGFGYPRGIKNDEIPLQSRIIAIADAFDAMTSERTYRKVFTNDQALDEIIRCSGTQFDPELVKIFAKNFKSLIEIKT